LRYWLIAIATALSAACDGPESHVYVAMPYEPSRDCLDPSTSLAIIDTPDGSLDCAPTCLVLPAPPAVGSEQVYVSTMCGPYPTDFDDSQTDPLCAPALAAFARGPDTCVAGGGSSDPADAGAE
jgi:hypothetical protein